MAGVCTQTPATPAERRFERSEALLAAALSVRAVPGSEYRPRPRLTGALSARGVGGSEYRPRPRSVVEESLTPGSFSDAGVGHSSGGHSSGAHNSGGSSREDTSLGEPDKKRPRGRPPREWCRAVARQSTALEQYLIQEEAKDPRSNQIMYDPWKCLQLHLRCDRPGVPGPGFVQLQRGAAPPV